jgi:hypothetical protein
MGESVPCISETCAEEKTARLVHQKQTIQMAGEEEDDKDIDRFPGRMAAEELAPGEDSMCAWMVSTWSKQ